MASGEFELKFRQFHDLMPHRVREVLLVSTPYDAFILEEDGQLTERLFIEYSELNLSSAPRVTHVKTGAEALEAMAARRFDTVIMTPRLSDMKPAELSRRVRVAHPGTPVILLAMDDNELATWPDAATLADSPDFDNVYLWTGDAKILLAIIKHAEDRLNVDHDIERADIRVIILVEDSIRYYSSFFGLLYSELMFQSQSLIHEGISNLHRLMRMRARPKILLATSFEEAERLFATYDANLLAVISDVRFPRRGRVQEDAGFELTRRIRARNPTLPILLQSAEPEFEETARSLGVRFCNKNDLTLLQVIRSFLLTDLGFGDFVFRYPDGREIVRVRSLYEMEKALDALPAESLEFHGRHNHISNWLLARSEFDLAKRLRPRQLDEFKSIEEVRQFLIAALRDARRETQRGAIADFSPTRFDPGSPFVRMGKGSIGGKARGLAFVNALLVRREGRDRFPDMEIAIPQTIALGTGAFDEFLEANDLHQTAYSDASDESIRRAFLAADLPQQVRENLGLLIENISHPIAVRSSSLLEDSQFRPFAGIYATVMLPNADPDPLVRLEELGGAIKMVWASTFSANAKAYMKNTPNRIEEEKMAVLIQRLVGARRGDLFYPNFAGVTQSYNYYPVRGQRAEDGVAQVVLGLGKGAVEGCVSLRFSPIAPQVLPQFASAKQWVKQTQHRFFALDMSRPRADLLAGQYSTLVECELSRAEADGTLALVGSTYSADDDMVRDTVDGPGTRLVTFNNVLKHGTPPLADALAFLLDISAKGMGGPVEIEFAVDMGDFGKPIRRGGKRRKPTLYYLQLRPMVTRGAAQDADVCVVPEGRRLCYSGSAMGFGVMDGLRDIVYVRPENFDPAATREIAKEIGTLNDSIGRPYILIGPGRWGTSDPWLGIPVQWKEISAAKVLVEASPEWFHVEPSQGTHFFQNITSLHLGYLTIEPDGGSGRADGEKDFLDWDWLAARPAARETRHLRHLVFNRPLTVCLDGKHGRGVIERQAPPDPASDS